MTGLNLETFLHLLRADLGAWATLGAVALLLALMAWTSWGSRRALRKCLMLSITAGDAGPRTDPAPAGAHGRRSGRAGGDPSRPPRTRIPAGCREGRGPPAANPLGRRAQGPERGRGGRPGSEGA